MIRAASFFFAFLILIPVQAKAGQVLQYKETIGGEVSTLTIDVVEKTSQSIKLKGQSSTGSQIYSELNGRDGSNLLWERTQDSQKVTAIRSQDRVEVRVEHDDKCEEKVYEIDSSPWIQSREFGMSGFADDPEVVELQFWALNPSDTSIVKMMGTRQEEKRIKCGDNFFDAFKVKVTLAGWKSIFWSSEFWFRKSDGVFLKYIGSASGPNSPEIISELVGEENGGSPEEEAHSDASSADPAGGLLAKVLQSLTRP